MVSDVPTRPHPRSYAELIVDELHRAEVQLVALVPDQKISSLVTQLHADPYIKAIPVAREDEGVGICCGAYYGGVRSILLMPNAGFMLTPYAVTTLSMYHRIPLLMLISNRGTLGDNARYQEYQGLLTEPMLDAMGVTSYAVDSLDSIEYIGQGLAHSQLYKRPVALLLEGPLLEPELAPYLDPHPAGKESGHDPS